MPNLMLNCGGASFFTPKSCVNKNDVIVTSLCGVIRVESLVI
jgi:hypothetical protein